MKLNSANHQEEHLHQQVEKYELLGNIPLARHVRNLITIEQQKRSSPTYWQIHKEKEVK